MATTPNAIEPALTTRQAAPMTADSKTHWPITDSSKHGGLPNLNQTASITGSHNTTSQTRTTQNAIESALTTQQAAPMTADSITTRTISSSGKAGGLTNPM